MGGVNSWTTGWAYCDGNRKHSFPHTVGSQRNLAQASDFHSFPMGTPISALVLLFLGAAAGTSPCWVHNCLIAGDRVFLSAHSGINFWIGNNPAANGYPRFPPGLRAGQAAMLQDSIDAAESAAGHPLKRGEVSRYWSAKTRDYIERYPLAWLRLLALKLRTFWSVFQYDDLSIITILRDQKVTFPGIYFRPGRNVSAARDVSSLEHCTALPLDHSRHRFAPARVVAGFHNGALSVAHCPGTSCLRGVRSDNLL